MYGKKSPQPDQAAVERRSRVAAMRLAGVKSERQIARAVGCSQATVNRDLKKLVEEWRERAAEDIAAAKGQDLDRIDALMIRVWEQAMRGDISAVREAQNLIKLRISILGTAAPTKIAGPDGTGALRVAHTHEHRHFDLSEFSPQERDELYDLVRRYNSGEAIG